ncbi:hypothetical protein GJ496_010978 [Pomphorhynchus laevis]|nr:hypothetical protein GJ496_010978 [Pomphorhynchus laevis]
MQNCNPVLHPDEHIDHVINSIISDSSIIIIDDSDQSQSNISNEALIGLEGNIAISSIESKQLDDEIGLVSAEIASLQANLRKARRRLILLKNKRAELVSNDVEMCDKLNSDCNLITIDSGKLTVSTCSKTAKATKSSNQLGLNNEKARVSILNFFSPIRSSSMSKCDFPEKKTLVYGFSDFQMSSTVRLAICNRATGFLKESDISAIHDRIRSNTAKINTKNVICSMKSRTVDNTIFTSDSNDEVLLVTDSEASLSNIITPIYTLKYFHFDMSYHRMPPYYGTWNKASQVISYINPLAKDLAIINYELDSDEEWEDNAPGDELESNDERSADEDCEEMQDGFFVPAGHLSGDELDRSDEDLSDTEEKTMEVAKMKFENWYIEASRKKLKRLIPKCFGCAWTGTIEYDSTKKMFEEYKTWTITYTAPDLPQSENGNTNNTKKTAKKQRKQISLKLTKESGSEHHPGIIPTSIEKDKQAKRVPSPKVKKRKIAFTPIN